jgi:hypothetical protein
MPGLNAPAFELKLKMSFPGLVKPSTDALMMHGLVDTEGHFEQLALVLPSDFDGEERLLWSLH